MYLGQMGAMPTLAVGMLLQFYEFHKPTTNVGMTPPGDYSG
jgi:hypothetical protein